MYFEISQLLKPLTPILLLATFLSFPAMFLISTLANAATTGIACTQPRPLSKKLYFLKIIFETESLQQAFKQPSLPWVTCQCTAIDCTPGRDFFFPFPKCLNTLGLTYPTRWLTNLCWLHSSFASTEQMGRRGKKGWKLNRFVIWWHMTFFFHSYALLNCIIGYHQQSWAWKQNTMGKFLCSLWALIVSTVFNTSNQNRHLHIGLSRLLSPVQLHSRPSCSDCFLCHCFSGAPSFYFTSPFVLHLFYTDIFKNEKKN